MAYRTAEGGASAPSANTQKTAMVDFSTAYMDLLSKAGMTEEQLSRLKFQIDAKKTFGPMLALQVLSDVKYPGVFEYEKEARDGSGESQTVTLTKEMGSVLRYLVSIYAVYVEQRDEADRNNREKLAIERSIATEKTKGRNETANSGRNLDDDEEGGGGGSIPGYVEGDVAGVTPEMHTFMNRLEETVWDIYGVNVRQEMENAEFSPEAAAARAVEKTHNAKELGDFVSFLVQLKESLPYLDREFSGNRIAKDPELAAEASRVITAVKSSLRQNPAYVAREAVNTMFGPDTMAVLNGAEYYDPKDGSSKGEASITKINGRLSDRASAARLISTIENATAHEPKVFVNTYTGESKDDPAGFFLGGTSYNIGGVRKGSEYQKTRKRLERLVREYGDLGTLLGEKDPKRLLGTLEPAVLRREADSVLGDMKSEEIDKIVEEAWAMHREGKETSQMPEETRNILLARCKAVYAEGVTDAIGSQKMIFRSALNQIQRAVYDDRINPAIEESVMDVLSGTFPYVEKGESGYHANEGTNRFIEDTRNVLRLGIEERARQMEMEKGIDYKGELPTGLETDTYIEMKKGQAYRLEEEAVPEYVEAFKRYYSLYRDSIDSQNAQIDLKNRIIETSAALFAEPEDRKHILDAMLSDEEKRTLESLSKDEKDRDAVVAALFRGDDDFSLKHWARDASSPERSGYRTLMDKVVSTIGGAGISYDDVAAARNRVDFLTDENGMNPLTDALMLYQESEKRIRLKEPLEAEGTGIDGESLEDEKIAARRNRAERRNRLMGLLSAGTVVDIHFRPQLNADHFRITEEDGTRTTYSIHSDGNGSYDIALQQVADDGTVTYGEPVKKDIWAVDDMFRKTYQKIEIGLEGNWRTVGTIDREELGKKLDEAYAEAYSITGLDSIADEGIRRMVAEVAERRLSEIRKEKAGDYLDLIDRLESYGTLTDSIVDATRNLMERNISALSTTYMTIAEKEGIKLDENEVESVMKGVVRTIWNERKRAAADAKAVETYNSYAVRGVFADRLDRLDSSSSDTINAFRNGAGTFIGLEEADRFVMDAMSREMGDMAELYHRYVRLHALSDKDLDMFRKAHSAAVAKRVGELENEAAARKESIARHEKLLSGSFSGARQYDLGITLQNQLAEKDIDALSADNERIGERNALRKSAVTSFEMMKDTLSSILTDSRARDITTGELKEVSEDDLDNDIFPVKDISLFLVKNDLERRVPGSLSYPAERRDFRFVIRMVQDSELEALYSLRSRLENGISHGYEQYAGSRDLPDSLKAVIQEGMERNRTLQAQLESVESRIALKRNEIAYREAHSSYVNSLRDLREAEERLVRTNRELDEIRRREESKERAEEEERARREAEDLERARLAADASVQAMRSLQADALVALKSTYALATGRDGNELVEKGLVPTGDEMGVTYIPDEITPKCIARWIEDHKTYQDYISRNGRDASFEEFRENAEAFIANNPVERFSTALRSYLDSVDAHAPEEERRRLLGNVSALAAEAPYMGREAKLLHQSNPGASREDIIAAADSFGSDRESIVAQDRQDRKELDMLESRIRMLTAAPDVLFVMTNSAIPDYTEEQKLLKDDIATARLLESAGGAVARVHGELRDAYQTFHGKDWAADMRELSAYVGPLYARLGSERNLDRQLDMLRDSALVSTPSKMTIDVERGHLDRNGYWTPEIESADPVFSTAFDNLRKYAISLNDGILKNGHHWTDTLTALSRDARIPARDAVTAIKKTFLSSYMDEVKRVKRELGTDEMNAFLKDAAQRYAADVNRFYEEHAPLSPKLSGYFTVDKDGKADYSSRSSFRRMISSDPRFRSVQKFLEFSQLPRTSASIIESGLFIKDLGAVKTEVKKDASIMSPDMTSGSHGSVLYGINQKNSIANRNTPGFCGLLFRTYGKSSISKEAVLAMLAARTGRDDAARKGTYSDNDLRRIRADLDPAKWEVVSADGGTAGGLSGLMMLIPKEPLAGIKTAEFIRKNPLYVSEGQVGVSSGISMDGIDEMRRFMRYRRQKLNEQLESGFLSEDEQKLVESRIASYSLELDDLDQIERAEKAAAEQGRSFIDDVNALKAFFTSDIDSRSSEFVASFDAGSRDNVIAKAVRDRNYEFDSDTARLEAVTEEREYDSPFGDAPRKDEGDGLEPEPARNADDGFFSAGQLKEAAMSSESSVDSPMRMKRDRFIEDIEKIRGRGIADPVVGVKKVFDLAFKTIDEKGTPLYADPEKFGFLLSFIRDNYRSDRRLSFYMTGGSLLDESFVSNVDEINLYKAIADGEGANEVSYLVYRMMFDEANVDINLNTKEIVKMEADTEDIRTDDAIDMSMREEAGSRLEGDEKVEKSIALEHFAANLPDYNEYGMNQDADNVQRMFAYISEERKSTPDNGPDSIYGRFSLSGINRFNELFALIDDYSAGRADEKAVSRLEELIPEEIQSIGRTDIDITADDVRSWFEAWNEGRDGDLSATGPAGIADDRKLLAIRSLLPLAGLEHAKEGTECRKAVLDRVGDLLDSIGGVDSDKVTWKMLVEFNDAVTDVEVDRHGLPDYGHLTIDKDELSDETREALGGILDDERSAGRLYRILATAGMEETVIPENMQDVLSMMAVTERRKMSIDEYVRTFSDVFSDELEEFRSARAISECFSDNRNASRLFKEVLDPLFGDGRRPDREKAMDGIRKGVENILGSAMKDGLKEISINTVPDRFDDESSIAEKISMDVAKAMSPVLPGMSPADIEEPSKAVAASFYRDVRQVASLVDVYVSDEMARAAKENRKPVISIQAAADHVRTRMTGNPNLAIISSKEVIGAVIRDLSEAKRRHEYIPQLPGHDTKALLPSVARHLAVEGGYLVHAVRGAAPEFMSHMDADRSSKLVMKAVEGISPEEWSTIHSRLTVDATGEAFMKGLCDSEHDQISVLSRTYGLKENVEDAIERIASNRFMTRYYVRGAIINNTSERMRDVIREAKALPAGTKASPADLMRPCAFFPVAGNWTKEEDGRKGWHFYSYVPIYSKDRAEELRNLLSRHADRSEAIREALKIMDLTSAALVSELAKGVRLRDVLGEGQDEMRKITVDAFTGMTSDEIALLPDDLSEIRMDGSRIDSEYIAQLHEIVEREDSIRREKEKGGNNGTSDGNAGVGDGRTDDEGKEDSKEKSKSNSIGFPDASEVQSRNDEGRQPLRPVHTNQARRSESVKAGIENAVKGENKKGGKA